MFDGAFTIYLESWGCGIFVLHIRLYLLKDNIMGQYHGEQRMYRCLRSRCFFFFAIYSADTTILITRHLRRGPQRQTP